MKIAVVYNRVSKRVINELGSPNTEKYGLKNIRRVTDALKAGGHQVRAFEGDKDLIENLEEFMPRVVAGERPGLVFNLAYGLQGQARYTHVPGMLEMVGMPYVGSGPLAHSLALDKVVAKMIFSQRGIPTPAFAVLDGPEAELPDLPYPLIVKPKNEAVSFGIRIVQDPEELREAAGVIFDRFRQAVLVEQYIEGREFNVGVIGNDPVETLPPVELSFGEGGPGIYTYEDKMGKSGREVVPLCPAPVPEECAAEASRIAREAFLALGCSDCARVDLRMDAEGKLYVLEINSLPSLGARGSYVAAATTAGLDFAALCQRLVEVASARYFGTPSPPEISVKEPKDPGREMFTFLTERRDAMERRLKEWVSVSSRTGDAVGIRESSRRARARMESLGLVPVSELSDGRHAWTFGTEAGIEGGTLLLAAIDVPLPEWVSGQAFRRDPEELHGEGIALSRAPLVQLEFALRALKRQRILHKLPLGVLFYGDEGAECAHSADKIREASSRASQVLCLRPGMHGDRAVHQRRGQRTFALVVEGPSRRLGRPRRSPSPLTWFSPRIERLSQLSDPKRRIAVGVSEVKTDAYPQLLPHRIQAKIQVSYPDAKAVVEVEAQMREVLGERGPRWILEQVADRPPLSDRKGNRRLFKSLQAVAQAWELPLDRESSVWPSAAGLVPKEVAVLCGLAPMGTDLFTPRESVQRLSLIQRTLLLTEFLGTLETRS